jgi:UDP-glucose 4-epimerase
VLTEAHAVNDAGSRLLAEAARNARVACFVFTGTGCATARSAGGPAAEDDASAPPDACPLSSTTPVVNCSSPG